MDHPHNSTHITPSPTTPPPVHVHHPDSQLHHSYSDPGLSRLDTPNSQNYAQPNEHTNQFNQPNQSNHYNQTNQYNQNNEYNQQTNQYNQTQSNQVNHSHLNTNSPTLPPSPSASRANPPPKPPSVFSRAPSSPSYQTTTSPTTSAAQPNNNPPPTLSLSQTEEVHSTNGHYSHEVHHEKEHGHHEHEQKDNHNHDHKGTHDCMLDSEVVVEIMAWEKRKANLQTKMDALMKKKTIRILHLSISFHTFIK